jgi:hypothetical protein
MATTSNYGWTTPDDTALVKDGASAIRSLGTAIDTSLNTALGTKKAGMVLLNTTSFSGVSSQSVNDVFSATYDNYRLVFNYLGSANSTARLKWRVAGADNSSNVYYSQGILASTTSVTASADGPVTTGHILGQHVTVRSMLSTYDVGNPFAALNTQFLGMRAKDGEFELKLAAYDAATSFTGFTIIPASGTITGTVSVYGYSK